MQIRCTASPCRRWFTPGEERIPRCPHCGREYPRRTTQGRIRGRSCGVLVRLDRENFMQVRYLWQVFFPGRTLPSRIRTGRLVAAGDWTRAQAQGICARIEARGYQARVISLEDARRAGLTVIPLPPAP